MLTRRILLLVLSLVLLIFPLPGGASGLEGKKVKVGVLPIADFLPVFAAVEKGYFKAEGLKVQIVPMAGGATILPALAGGSLQIGTSNVISIMLAAQQGFDFKIIADCVYVSPGQSGIFVRRDSGITSLNQLAGKSWAVNTTRGILWLYVRELLSMNGIDSAGITFVEIPFPKMAAPLLTGQVDVVSPPEPFNTILQANPEIRYLGEVFTRVNPGGIVAPFIARMKWIEANSGTVEGFARALAKGVDYSNAHRDEVRLMATRHTRLKAPLARKIKLAIWKNRVDINALQWTANLMTKHKLINKRIDVEELVYRTAR